MPQAELLIYEDSEELAAAAAERICRAAAESIAARGRFTLCLTGGSTPRKTYTILARQKCPACIHHAPRDVMPHEEREEYNFWPRTFLFFGDERFVPPDDDRSNYKMVRDSLLQNAPIAADHVFAMPTHFSSPQDAADDYARTLKAFFGDVAWPEFDLVLARAGRRRAHGLALPGSGGPAGDGPLGDLQSARRAPTARRSGHADFSGVQCGHGRSCSWSAARTRPRPWLTFIRAASPSRHGPPWGFARPAGKSRGWSIGRPREICERGSHTSQTCLTLGNAEWRHAHSTTPYA